MSAPRPTTWLPRLRAVEPQAEGMVNVTLSFRSADQGRKFAAALRACQEQRASIGVVLLAPRAAVEESFDG